MTVLRVAPFMEVGRGSAFQRCDGGVHCTPPAELHGVAGYNEYRIDREAAGTSTMDEWIRLIPELDGASGGN